MAIGRISTYALFQGTLRDATRTQLDLFNLQNQLSSGLKSSNFAGIADKAEQFIDLEAKISKSQLYQDSNQVALVRINVTSNTLGNIVDTAAQLKNLILQRRNASFGVSLEFDQQIQGLWNTLTTQLNTSVEGRFLFSGTRTDTPAVKTDTFPELAVSGVADAGYYQGSDQDVTLRPQDNLEITYNVRGDNEAFQNIFAGLAMAKRGDQTGSDSDLQQAYDFVEEGVNQVISLQATINAKKVSVEAINDQHESLALYWRGVKEEISNVDIVSASTQVAIDQGILQATFQAFGRINALKLTDYLR